MKAGILPAFFVEKPENYCISPKRRAFDLQRAAA